MFSFFNHWKWFAWGKHPSMEDFMWAGAQTPLFQRFSKWVDKGFARLQEQSNLRSRNCSWRFWTKGAGTDIVCGLVRNSCDTLGRNFPLLYIGTGGLKDWPDNSALLPCALEPIWKNVEYVSSARFDTIGQLNDSLSLIEQPKPNWMHYQHRLYNLANNATPATCQESEEDGKKLLRFNCPQPEFLPLESRFCRQVTPMDQSPMAVFIGEIQSDIAVAIINTALTPEDFSWIWGLNQEDPVALTQKERIG